jgi:hypothetical protein
MSNQTGEAVAYIEREYKDVKGRVELQRRVVEQLHNAGRGRRVIFTAPLVLPQARRCLRSPFSSSLSSLEPHLRVPPDPARPTH